jgi:hypothetical protein
MQAQTQTPIPQPATPLTRRQRAAAREQAVIRRQAARVAITEKILQRNLFRLAKRHDGSKLRAQYLALAQRVVASRRQDDGAAPFMVEMIGRLERGDQTVADWLEWRLQTTEDRELRFMLTVVFELAGKRIERRREVPPVLNVRSREDEKPGRPRGRQRGTRLNITRRPRARGAGRPKAAPTRRPTSGGRDGPPDDDGSGSSEPPAPGRRTIYTYAVVSREHRGEGI